MRRGEIIFVFWDWSLDVMGVDIEKGYPAKHLPNLARQLHHHFLRSPIGFELNQSSQSNAPLAYCMKYIRPNFVLFNFLDYNCKQALPYSYSFNVKMVHDS